MKTKKPRPRETECLARGHKAGKGNSQDLNQGLLTSYAVFPHSLCVPGLFLSPTQSGGRLAEGRQTGTAAVQDAFMPELCPCIRHDYRVLTEQHTPLKTMSKNVRGLLFTKQLHCVSLPFPTRHFIFKEKKKEMEKMKGCQHWIITWAPGIGSFSVPAGFPLLLAFLNFLLT